MLLRPRFFDRILVLADIAAGRSNNWIATNRSHARAFVRSIRRQHTSYETIQWKECMDNGFQNQWDQLFDWDSIHFDRNLVYRFEIDCMEDRDL
jgi:hypothetical protein